jgi:DNA sulfur modification protein DndB
MQGVPKGIRIACDERFNNSDGQLERHQFLTLSNYPEIVQFGENWEEFKDYYSFPEKGRKKADQVAWIQRLTIARNITHHVEKGPLSKGQVDYVRRVHRLVKTHIEGGEKVVAGKLYLSDLSEKGPAIEAAD